MSGVFDVGYRPSRQQTEQGPYPVCGIAGFSGADVRPDEVNRGYGRRLVAAALGSVAETGTPDATVILVGDLPYYGPFGFAEAPRGQIRMPGPVDPARLLIWRGPDGTRAVPGGSVRAAST